MASNPLYKLSCSIMGHSSDVRGVATTPEGEIVTVSRDLTAKLWAPENENRFIESNTFEGHTGYVSSVCIISTNDDSSSELIATGAKDSTILIFSKSNSSPIHNLTGHKDTVSCLSWKYNCLVSGSWDHSVRVWQNWECVSELKAHSGPVWAVAILQKKDLSEPVQFLSASADKTVKCWKDQKVVVTYSGHTDCVRSLCVIDNEHFLSCSNDASVRLWGIQGTCLATYYGHTNFIYSICTLGVGAGFVTGGEDRSVRLWGEAGQDVQSIHLPAHSVWSVAALPNGDIVVGSSDGVCRIFSQDPSRQAAECELKEFSEAVSSFHVPAEEVGGIRKSELPDESFLLQPGKRDGQTSMVRRQDGKVFCYSWSAAKGEWQTVGEVVGDAGGSASSAGKALYEGKQYDFVFEVATDDGRAYKLPFNAGEDPWVAAQAFVHRHELPQDSLDEVANFIVKNAGINAFTPSQGVCDPFTGGARYVPGGSAVTSSPYFPQKTPLRFDTCNSAGTLSKLRESNEAVPENMRLASEDLELLVNGVSSTDFSPTVLDPLKIALQWSPDRIWPALDVLRLALRSCDAQKHWLGDDKGGVLVSLLVNLAQSPGASTAQLLALRCLANMAIHPAGCGALKHCFSSLSTAVAAGTPFANRNLEIAAATLLINLSVVLYSDASLEDRCQLLSSAATMLLSTKDSEAQFRALVAAGTTLSAGGKEVKSFAHSLDLQDTVKPLSSHSSPAKVAECARHILAFL